MAASTACGMAGAHSGSTGSHRPGQGHERLPALGGEHLGFVDQHHRYATLDPIRAPGGRIGGHQTPLHPLEGPAGLRADQEVEEIGITGEVGGGHAFQGGRLHPTA